MTLKSILMLALTSATVLKAETWNGTLVDVMCKAKDLANHTVKCAMSCSKSGYGLVLADGTFLKLDEAGNAKAFAALKSSGKEKNLKATITGTRQDQLLKAESVQLQ